MHGDVIKWKYFPRYWPFVRGIHRSPVNSPHKGQWHGALMFSLICALSKQSKHRWFVTPSRPFWRHCNVIYLIVFGIHYSVKSTESRNWYNDKSSFYEKYGHHNTKCATVSDFVLHIGHIWDCFSLARLVDNTLTSVLNLVYISLMSGFQIVFIYFINFKTLVKSRLSEKPLEEEIAPCHSWIN